MIDTGIIEILRRKFTHLASEHTERGRRRWAASEALELGHGGLQAVAQATGLGERTIRRGCDELCHHHAPERPDDRRIRRAGGRRKTLQSHEPALVSALEALVEPTTRGDPMSPLRWTCKSTRKLAKALAGQGYQVSHTTVAQLLADLDYSLQGTRKTLEGASHPDRDAQFRSINRCVKVFQRAGQPVIAVDAKKKELVGPCANGGRDSQPKGQPERVQTHDVPDKELGKICPYGVYDPTHTQGWVSVGIDHDTAQFAVESIRRWWGHIGKIVYPQAHALLITADGGGSNASRNRLWKIELQQLADEIGVVIYVRHFPPGTSKWNKIEHRMFCHITETWRGRPLVDRMAVVELIAATTTKAGLKVESALDIQGDAFHPEWNYTTRPRPTRLEKAAKRGENHVF